MWESGLCRAIPYKAVSRLILTVLLLLKFLHTRLCGVKDDILGLRSTLLGMKVHVVRDGATKRWF